MCTHQESMKLDSDKDLKQKLLILENVLSRNQTKVLTAEKTYREVVTTNQRSNQAPNSHSYHYVSWTGMGCWGEKGPLSGQFRSFRMEWRKEDSCRAEGWWRDSVEDDPGAGGSPARLDEAKNYPVSQNLDKEAEGPVSIRWHICWTVWRWRWTEGSGTAYSGRLWTTRHSKSSTLREQEQRLSFNAIVNRVSCTCATF